VTYHAPRTAFSSTLVDVGVDAAGKLEQIVTDEEDNLVDVPTRNNIYVGRPDASGNIVGDDFAAGEAVVYHAIGPKQLIRFAGPHGLETGEPVVYRNLLGG